MTWTQMATRVTIFIQKRHNYLNLEVARGNDTLRHQRGMKHGDGVVGCSWSKGSIWRGRGQSQGAAMQDGLGKAMHVPNDCGAFESIY